jgi:hypothetical protein
MLDFHPEPIRPPIAVQVSICPKQILTLLARLLSAFPEFVFHNGCQQSRVGIKSHKTFQVKGFLCNGIAMLDFPL